MRGKWVWISVLAVGVGVGGAALSMRKRPPAPVPAGAAVTIPATSEITLNGAIRPQHVTSVGASVEGNVEAFLANVGDEVYQGQVLARIGEAGLESTRGAATSAAERSQGMVSRAESAVNSARLEASRADADAQRARLQTERAQKAFERQSTLHKSGATPRIVYEKAEQDYQAAVKEQEIMENASRASRESVQSALEQVESAKKLLAQKTQELADAEAAFEAAEVRSPADGTVVGRKGEVGKLAQEAGDQLFQIATDLYAMEVPLAPEPPVLKRIRPGDPATVLILDLQSTGIPGTVKEIKDNQVIVEFNSTTPAIRPGMRADVRLKLE
jgi:HlyD family secretion protein